MIVALRRSSVSYLLMLVSPWCEGERRQRLGLLEVAPSTWILLRQRQLLLAVPQLVFDAGKLLVDFC